MDMVLFLTGSDSLFRSDEQPELNLENDYLNKTGHNLMYTILGNYFVGDGA